MGLEIVELVMAFEERFGIEIPDAEAPSLTTPGKVIAYICAQLEALDDGRCASQRSFYRVRRVLVSATGARRSEVHPTVPIDSLLPLRERSRRWPMIVAALGVKHSLRRPPWLKVLLASLTVLSLVAVVRSGGEHGLLLALTVPAVFAWVLVVATRPAALSVGLTVGELALAALPLHAAAALPEASWTRSAVAAAVRQIIREQLGIQTFSDDADFIRDLHVG